MRKIIALLLALCMLSACGDSAVSQDEPAASEAVFGASVLPEETAKITPTPVPEERPEQEAEQASVEESESPQEEAEVISDLTDLTIQAVLYCDLVDSYYYSQDDPVYFWRAVSCLVGLVGDQYPAATVEDDLVTIAAGDLSPFVTALFGDYSGQYPSTGEENPVVYATYEDGQDIYHMTCRDMTDFQVETQSQWEGDTLYVSATVTYAGESASYHLTLSEDPEAQWDFRYSLTSVERD